MSASGEGGPLAGMRVVDVTENVAGPFCTQLLADLGAEVIKIERPPLGDVTRSWGPPFWGGHSVMFLSLNRSKRSVALDLKDRRAAGVFRRLVERADVLVENYRPGTMERLGLGYAALSRANPRLVYCSVTGFGDRGPESHRGGYDTLLQAEVGLMKLTGHPGGPPTRVGTSIVDFGAGLWAAIGVLAALQRRQQTGQGGRVHTSLLQTAAAWVSFQHMAFLATGKVPEPFGTSLPMAAPYQAYETADGHVAIGTANDKLFADLVAAIGLPELRRDPRFATNRDRVAHREALNAEIAPVIAASTTAALLRRLEAAGVPCARVNDVSALTENEQLAALDAFLNVPHRDIPNFTTIRSAIDIEGCDVKACAPPGMGEHTVEVLRELDMDPETLNHPDFPPEEKAGPLPASGKQEEGSRASLGDGPV